MSYPNCSSANREGLTYLSGNDIEIAKKLKIGQRIFLKQGDELKCIGNIKKVNVRQSNDKDESNSSFTFTTVEGSEEDIHYIDDNGAYFVDSTKGGRKKATKRRLPTKKSKTHHKRTGKRRVKK